MATTALTPAATGARSGLYDWLTTTDHKKIGILYLANSFVMFIIGGILALVVRAELAFPGLQLVKEDTYNEAFTIHASLSTNRVEMEIPCNSRSTNHAGSQGRAL